MRLGTLAILWAVVLGGCVTETTGGLPEPAEADERAVWVANVCQAHMNRQPSGGPAPLAIQLDHIPRVTATAAGPVARPCPLTAGTQRVEGVGAAGDHSGRRGEQGSEAEGGSARLQRAVRVLKALSERERAGGVEPIVAQIKADELRAGS